MENAFQSVDANAMQHNGKITEMQYVYSRSTREMQHIGNAIEIR